MLGLDSLYTGDFVYMNREYFVTENGQGLSTYEAIMELAFSQPFSLLGMASSMT